MNQYARAWVPQQFGVGALGDVTNWQRWYADPEDVYLWRAELRHADIESPEDLKLFVRAVAQALNPKAALEPSMDLDVRGITVGYLEGGTPRIDVVLTADSTKAYVAPISASSVATSVSEDPTLRERYPELSIDGPRFLELTGPPASKDFWHAQGILYDDVIGPLDAFAKGEGIFKGQADDGPSLKAWKPEPPPELGPPGEDHEDTGLSTGTKIVAGIAAMGLVYAGARYFTEKP